MKRRSFFGWLFGAPLLVAPAAASAPDGPPSQGRPSDGRYPIRIELDAVGVHSRVFIGDFEITHMCQAVQVQARVGELTTADFQLAATKGVEVLATGDAVVNATVLDYATLNDRTGEPALIAAREIRKVSRV